MWMPSGGSRATARKPRLATCVLMVMLVLALGCQAPSGASKSQWTAAKIDSFESIAGKWAGLMVREPRSRQEDWVRLTIAADGAYEFTSYRTIGVFNGRGQLTLSEGKLTVKTERATASGSLWGSDAHRKLQFVAVMTDGTKYTTELEPAR